MKNNLFSRISQDKIERYLDGTLGEQETTEIDSMLDDDPQLQLLVDDYVNMQMSLNNDDLDKARRHSNRLKFIKIAITAASIAAIVVVSWIFLCPEENLPTSTPDPIYRGTDTLFEAQPDTIPQDTIDSLP